MERTQGAEARRSRARMLVVHGSQSNDFPEEIRLRSFGFLPVIDSF